MTDRNIKLCRFCMKKIYDDEFDIIGEITRQMLDTLLLKLNLSRGKHIVMCHECATKLQNAVNFKITCTTENKILPFINCGENVKLELKEDGLKENKVVESINVSKNQKVCRFCVRGMESGCYTYLQEKKENVFIVDTIQKYIPELHLSIIEEWATCDSCRDSLQDLSSFIKDCLNVEEKIKGNMDETDADGELKLNDIEEVMLKCEVSCNDDNIGKVEEKYDVTGKDTTMDDETGYEKAVVIDNGDLNSKNEEIGIKSEPVDCESYPDMTDQVLSVGVKCDRDRHLSKKEYIDNLKKHTQDLSQVFKCEKCSVETKHKITLKRQSLTHQDILEVTGYKCEICSHETEYKGGVKKAVSEVLECEECSYVTKCNYQLKSHMLVHKSISETTAYKCESCSFKTKYKSSLTTHWRRKHQDRSSTIMYKCKTCPYETEYRADLKNHRLTHQNPSEETYKCKKCPFETKRKISLTRHRRTHRKHIELQEYECDKCSFKTNYKYNIERHCMAHQNLSEVTVYKCETCSYVTTRKKDIKNHMLIHQNLSDSIEV